MRARRTLTVRIEADDETCGACVYRQVLTCGLFGGDLDIDPKRREFLRLPQCRAAERATGERSASG